MLHADSHRESLSLELPPVGCTHFVDIPGRMPGRKDNAGCLEFSTGRCAHMQDSVFGTVDVSHLSFKMILSAVVQDALTDIFAYAGQLVGPDMGMRIDQDTRIGTECHK